MTEIRFYHMTAKTLEQALPEILQKAVSGGRRAVVKTSDDKMAEYLCETLWTCQTDAFLPHGTKKDGFAGDQPVWITAADENPNKADILVLTRGCTAPDMGAYALCCEMLDGNDDEAVLAARARWKVYKEAGHELAYWQQNPQGGWEKKA